MLRLHISTLLGRFSIPNSYRLATRGPFIQRNCVYRQFHLTSTTFVKSNGKTTTFKEEPTYDQKADDLLLELNNIYKDRIIGTKLKRKRLTEKVLDIVRCLPDGVFKPVTIPFMSKVINFLGPSQFEYEELISVLQAVVSGLDANNVRTCQYIPIFYNELVNWDNFKKDPLVRLQVVEIFINYVTLSTNRTLLHRYLDSLALVNNNDLVRITLEAFKTRAPDSKTMVKLAELSDFEDNSISNEILIKFLEACDLELGKNCQLEDSILTLLGIIDIKSRNDFSAYVNVLYFCSKNNLNSLARTTLGKIELMPNNKVIFESLSPEDTNVFVLVATKYSFIPLAKRAIELHKFNPSDSNDCITMSLQTLMQGEPMESLVAKLEQQIENLENDESEEVHHLQSVESYNKILEAVLNLDKPEDYIVQLTTWWKSEHGLERNSDSFALLISKSLDQNDYQKALHCFEESLAEYVHWGVDEEGINMTHLFRLLSMYITESSDAISEKFTVFQKVKSFGHRLDKETLAVMAKLILDQVYIGDLIELLERELPPFDDPKNDRFEVSQYSSLYNLLMDFVLSYEKDSEINWLVYGQIQKYFHVPQESYIPVMKFFCEHERPNAAYLIFHTMRNLHKKKGLDSPTEEIYTYLFSEFGKQLYEEGVFKLHLFLKMDQKVNVDINMLNAILEGYVNLQDILKARDVFNNALSLPKEKGVNETTINLMLKTNTYISLQHTKNFWNNLSQIDYTPTVSNLKQYLIAHCYHGKYSEALKVLQTSRSYGDLEIDADLLATVYNWTLSPKARLQLKEWAQTELPESWKQAEARNSIQENTELPTLIDVHKNIKSIE
ncbi:BA75_02975T0 [Komagataella pastoris]|uniref:BA75_02975T0 n=1 Tax=Komagataella pastoris TaxID=4922 RepID=A0A1B2JDV2_PICPA|nr:BA75_02975T0 [Komagataella pastoris]